MIANYVGSSNVSPASAGARSHASSASRRLSSAILPLILVAVSILLSGCAPTLITAGPTVSEPSLTDTALVAADGARLPLRIWRANPHERAVIVALHGFNDYSNSMTAPAGYWTGRGITVYAYDQRGFGDAPNHGYWHGTQTLVDDFAAAVRVVRARHPGVPVFALGDSMGGAVVMVAMAGAAPPPIDGAILVAPAVWARSMMPFYQRWALSLSAYTVPAWTVTGRGLKIVASDNLEMLRALLRDPKVIKATRIDALWGIANLMDEALAAAERFDTPALILHGARDQIITDAPMVAMLGQLPAAAARQRTVIRYDDGYHMLLRDLQAERVWRDVMQWIERRLAASQAASRRP